MKNYGIVDKNGNFLMKSNNLLKLLKIVRCSVGPRYYGGVYEKYFKNPITVVPVDKIWNDCESGKYLNSLTEFDLDYGDRCDYEKFEYYYKNTKRSYDSYTLDL